MKALASLPYFGLAVMLCACAGQPASEGDQKVRLSPGAKRIVEEEGRVAAPEAGTKAARESDVVCKRRTRTGTHMTERYCYSRAEAERQRTRTRQAFERAISGADADDDGR